MAATKKADAASKPAAKPPTKAEVFRTISEQTGVSKKDVTAVFGALNDLIKKNLSGRNAPGQFTVPGLMKLTVRKKPATKARKGINPFTGEATVFKAKPASKTVKVTALKGLKDMV
jgi:nucleoid DNA-binding protein